MVETRPNIAFATLVISQFSKNLLKQHIKAVKTIIHYLKAIKNVGIIYGNKNGGDFIIKGYSNSIWAKNYNTKSQPLVLSLYWTVAQSASA